MRSRVIVRHDGLTKQPHTLYDGQFRVILRWDKICELDKKGSNELTMFLKPWQSDMQTTRTGWVDSPLDDKYIIFNTDEGVWDECAVYVYR